MERYTIKSPVNGQLSSRFLNYLKKGVLTTQGKSFIFRESFVTETKTYTREPRDFFPGLKKRNTYTDSKAFKEFIKDAERYSPDVTITKESVCFCDERSKTASYARVETGYTVTCSVNETLSHRLFSQEYGVQSLRFRDILLSQHKETIDSLSGKGEKGYRLIEDFHRYKYADTHCESTSKSHLYVSSEGIWTKYHGPRDSENSGNRFMDFGMADLPGKAEWYGMALAIIEMNRPQWETIGKPIVEIYEYMPIGYKPGVVCATGITYWVEIDKPIVKKW